MEHLKCKKRIVLCAFSEGTCEKCGVNIVCSTTPESKICEKCSEEHDICEFCGEEL